ncbi:hypothetical protein ACFE04_029142 [Oxalis oulophora]
MQPDQHFYTEKGEPYFANQMGNNYENFHVPPDYGSNLPFDGIPTTPFHGIEFQPSEVCPKNFVIFDQTDHRSQIMYHPTISHKFTAPSLNEHAAYFDRNFQTNDINYVDREISEQKEDSDDIDALLSSEEEENGGSDNEEVSTGRTFGNYGCNSPDSCSNYSSKPGKISSSSFTAESSSRSGAQGKRHKMKKMIKGLRGIVPGGDQMNTTADVLDEAVQYLKSLKVEAQKLGVELANVAFQKTLGVANLLCCIHVTNTYLCTIALSYGPSMLPTINLNGDLVLAERISTRFGKVGSGDIVLLRSPIVPRKVVTKRVVGVEGDNVTYFVDPQNSDEQKTIVVPKGHVWVEGDYIYDSTDSRLFGPVPYGLLHARVFCRVWPVRDFGSLGPKPN